MSITCNLCWKADSPPGCWQGVTQCNPVLYPPGGAFVMEDTCDTSRPLDGMHGYNAAVHILGGSLMTL